MGVINRIESKFKYVFEKRLDLRSMYLSMEHVFCFRYYMMIIPSGYGTDSYGYYTDTIIRLSPHVITLHFVHDAPPKLIIIFLNYCCPDIILL